MSNSTVHIVILVREYAERNFAWLNRFVFHNEQNGLYSFACHSYAPTDLGGMVRFEVVLKTNAERENVLIPLPYVEGILLQWSHRSQLGFLYQEDSRDK